MRRQRLSFFLGLAVVLITALCYLPATRNQFVNVDDQVYITDNVHVSTGLTWQNIVWAFRSGYASNWHPLTWISHMVDCQLWGLAPSGHHLSNFLVHSVNTLLVFLLLISATGRQWPSAFVAAFFGWHPLHVESVAWASERKDVLSTFFWLLAMLAYVRYTRPRGALDESSPRLENLGSSRVNLAGISPRAWYWLTLLLFALGLMSKPMVVTLPFVLVLFDFWPLRRFELIDLNKDRSRVRGLLIEKILFFALSIASCVVTYIAQDKGGATSSLSRMPILLRIENSLIAYGSYLGKTVWPAKLYLFYPYSNHPPLLDLLTSISLLLAVTVLCLLSAKKYPFLTVGWFWFIGTLVPVIGLVQVGSQSMADRYMYIPGIGLFLLPVWGAAALLERLPQSSFSFSAAGAAALGVCLVLTSGQLSFWQNGVALGRHGVAIMPQNHLAYNQLAGALDEAGNYQEAYACCQKAVVLEPGSSESHYNLAASLMRRGEIPEAIAHYQIALKGNPRFGNAAHGLGNACYQLGHFEEALEHLSTAVQLDPNNAELRSDFGTALLAQNKVFEATGQLGLAVRLDPRHLPAQRNLAIALARQGRVKEALPHFEKAVELAPGDPESHFNLGLALLDSRTALLAEAQFAECVRLRPNEPRFHYHLANASAREHKTAQALHEYRTTLQLSGESVEALNELAWILATTPDAGLRSGVEAATLAEKACELTRHANPEMLATLAAAYAESGRFAEAVEAGSNASKLAREKGQAQFALKADQWLANYEAGKPIRESL